MRTAEEIVAARKPKSRGAQGETGIRRPEAVLGEKLRAARLSVDLTQVEVAAELGLSKYTVLTNWEIGVCAPSARHLAQLAHLYRVSLDVFCAHYVEARHD